MALEWFYSQTRSQSPLFSDFWTLVQLPPGVTLKRTIISWHIDMLGTDNASVEFWSSINVVNTLEMTFGSPPPFPENPGISPLSGRDLLHLDETRLSVVSGTSVSFVLSTADDDSGIGRWDTKVQRRNDVVPAELFWSWGVTASANLPATGALSRFTSAVLVDGPDVELARMAVQFEQRAAKLRAPNEGDHGVY